MARQTLFYRDSSGRRLASVTEILAISGVSTSFEMVPPEVLERARQRGADVAAWIEQDELGQTLVPSPEIAGYVAAYRKFRVEVPFRVLACEEPVLQARYGYAGTLDLRGVEHAVAGDVGWILDVKCTFAIPAEAGLQLAGYRLALQDGQSYRRGVLHLKPNGTWSRVEYRKHREDEHTFLACLQVARWLLNTGRAQLDD